MARAWSWALHAAPKKGPGRLGEAGKEEEPEGMAVAAAADACRAAGLPGGHTGQTRGSRWPDRGEFVHTSERNSS